MVRQLVVIFGYIVATAIVVVGTIALIAYGNGVSYDFKTGRIVHNGLIILQSTPSGATVSIDGKVQRQRTPYRNTFLGGSYDFTLTKSGYRTWEEPLWVVASEADLAQYVILLPEHLVGATYGTYPAISQSLESRDHSLVAFVVPSGPTAGVWTLDTGSHKQTRVYASAPATAAAPAETVQLLGWANDSSRLLIKSDTGSASTLLVVSAGGGGAPVDLDATFKQDVDGATFNPNNSQQLYWLDSTGDLRRLDLGAQTVSPVLADHVAAFTYADNNLLYINTATTTPSLWSLNSGGTKTQLVASVPPSATYELAFTTYIGTPEVAVASQDSSTVTLYSNIYDKPVAATTLAAAGQHVAFNGDGRFLLQYDTEHVAVYDLQRNLTYSMSQPNSAVTGISWFDNYHLVFNRGGQIVLSEFNGNYATVLASGDSLPPFGSEDTKRVIVTAPTAAGATVIKALKIRQ